MSFKRTTKDPTIPNPLPPHLHPDPTNAPITPPQNSLNQPQSSQSQSKTIELPRQSRSTSIKQKLNLENTRLRINIDNLSSLVSAHQYNQTKYKLEVDAYKDKLAKYKDKIKDKDLIITKLLEKLEKRIQMDGNKFTSIVLKMHEDFVASYKAKISKNQQIPSTEILQKYQQLLKSFKKQQKQRLTLKYEKQDLQNTIKQLKETIRYIGEGEGKNQSKDYQQYIRESQIERDRMKLRLNQAGLMLEKEKNVRKCLLGVVGGLGVDLLPEVKTMLADLERSRGIQATTQVQQDKKEPKSNLQIANLKQRLAQSQTNLFRQREARKGTQKHCTFIQQQLKDLSKNIVVSNHNLQSLKQRLQKIQTLYSKQVSQLQQKTQILLRNETDLEQYRTHIEDLSNKFTESIKNFAEESSKWAKLENQYQRKIDQYRANRRKLEDRLEREVSKRKLFQLKIIGEDKNNLGINFGRSQPNNEGIDQNQNLEDIGSDKTVYLDQRIDQIQKQSTKNRKQNEDLNYELIKNEKITQALRIQLQEANQKISSLQNLLKNSSSQSQPSKKIQQLQANLFKVQTQLLRKQEENRDLIQKLKSRPEGKKILGKGESYVEKSTIEGGYEVNIINSNQLPKEIQRMEFQELASRYLAATDQLMYLKQKMQQNLNSSQQKPRPQPIPNQRPQPQPFPRPNPSNLQMILSQTQNEPEDGYSQQIDDTTYKNINEEMDRLIHKNKQLQKQLQLNKQETSNQIGNLMEVNGELKEKLKSAEEINTNLSNIVVHLESQLSRYQNNLDISMQEQRGSQVMEGSGKKDSGMYNLPQIQKIIEQKRKQFQDLLKSTPQSKQTQTKLKALQNEIITLQQHKKIKKQKSLKSASSYPENQQHQYQHLHQRHHGRESESSPLIPVNDVDQACQNCQNLTKLASQLIQKLGKLQKEKEDKLKGYKAELQQVQSSKILPDTNDPKSQQLHKQNQNLRRLLTQIKTELLFQTKQQQQYENQIKNLREINEELVSSIHEKEKQMLKLRTEIYRQNYGAGVMNEASAKKIDDIFQSYERKVDELEGILKNQEKNQINISDLYDTINYLNSQCENLRKNAQNPSTEPAHPETQPLQPIPQPVPLQPQIPQSHSQLSQKYKSLHNYLSSLTKTSTDHNFPSIESMLNSIKQQKQLNIDLMKQNNKLHNKIAVLGQKYQEYFRKIQDGKVYQIIQGKDRENQGLRGQLDLLGKERERMFEENQKISRDLRSIQDNIQKLTGGKISGLQSTLGFDKTTASKLPQLPDPLSKLSQKLQSLKSTLISSSHKSRPIFQPQSYPQLPPMQQILIILLDRLHYAWNLIEDRTLQYNQLRDQMNIISLECMKNNNGMYEDEGKDGREDGDGSRSKSVEIIEERYEEVLVELVEYQNQNKRLQREVSRLKHQVAQYKKQLEQIQSKCLSQIKSQSSEQVPYNQQILQKLLQSGASRQKNGSDIYNGNNGQVPEIIRLFLARIKELESNLEIIQVEFDQKNKKLDNIIQKEKSFISDKSKALKQSDEIMSNQPILKKRSQDEQRQPSSPQPPKAISASVNISQTPQQNPSPSPHLRPQPQQLTQQKSYTMNSARVFRQIQQLTRLNQELREKKNRYRSCLESVGRILEALLGKYRGNMDEKLGMEIQGVVKNVGVELEEDGRRQGSVFDFDADCILGASFAHKAKGSVKLLNKGLQQVQNTLQAKSQSQIPKKSSTSLQTNLKFLQQNKYIFQQLLTKLSKQNQLPQPIPIEDIKNKLASRLSDKQLQEILYLIEPDQAVERIQGVLEQATPVKRVGDKGDRGIDGDGDVSIEEGEWVETEQLQSIINKIYPHKTELCLIVANSINMLMLAQTKQGILKSVQYLFTNLKKKQHEIREQLKKRDESVTEYGRKLQKLLMSKYSQQQSQQKSDLLNENSFRKTLQFKSQYEIKKEEDRKRVRGKEGVEKDGDRRGLNKSESNSQSQSYSGFINEK